MSVIVPPYRVRRIISFGGIIRYVVVDRRHPRLQSRRFIFRKGAQALADRQNERFKKATT